MTMYMLNKNNNYKNIENNNNEENNKNKNNSINNNRNNNESNNDNKNFKKIILAIITSQAYSHLQHLRHLDKGTEIKASEEAADEQGE